MKNSIETKKRVMGYVEVHERPGSCGTCLHVRLSGGDLRCPKGGFFVRAVSYCREFERRAKVAIGPTDI